VNDTTDPAHFLDNPESDAARERIVAAIEREGDRGAALVAGEMLSEFLMNALVHIRQPNVSKSEQNALFKGAGPLGSWSARIRVAALIGLISERSRACLDAYRGLRNLAAHSEAAFSLKQNSALLLRALELGDDVPGGVRELALHFTFESYTKSLQAHGEDLRAELQHNPFERIEDIWGHIQGREDIMEGLDEKAWRLQLGIGVWMLLSLMRFERDRYCAKLRG
jgi:hypothetical protein